MFLCEVSSAFLRVLCGLPWYLHSFFRCGRSGRTESSLREKPGRLLSHRRQVCHAGAHQAGEKPASVRHHQGSPNIASRTRGAFTASPKLSPPSEEDSFAWERICGGDSS